jgi:hypothetical protein
MVELKSSMTFAIFDGKIVHVDEVENGLACCCSCPSCGERLIAKQGAATAHHFAHKGESNCTGSVQTTLHLAAKEIISREKRMVLPALLVEAIATDARGGAHQSVASLPSKEVTFEDVFEETRFGRIIPDIQAKVGDRMLFVEVAVHHFTDDDKKQKLAEAGIATVEIDLSGISDGWDWDNLFHAVVESTDTKIWLFNPRASALLDVARKDADAKARKADKLETKRKEEIALSHDYQRASIPGFRSAIAMLEKLCEPKQMTNEKARMASEGPSIGAWKTASRMLNAQWESAPDFINIEVPGESGFLVDRRVWQAAVFTMFVKGNRNKTFSGKTAVRWSLKYFPRRTEFAILQQHQHLLTTEQMAILPWASKAMSAYLRELEKRGYLRSVGGRYEIIKI